MFLLFWIYNLNYHSLNSVLLQSLLRESDHSEADEAISRIIDVLSNLNLPSPVVDKSVLESAVSECNDDVQPENSDKVTIRFQILRIKLT